MRQPLTLVLAAAVSTSVIARQQPTFRAGVDAVRVDVSVTDHGKPVRGLKAQDFVVADNGTPEPVTSVTLEQLPLRVVLLLDTSGSVEGSAMQTLVDASQGLIRALRPTDRIAVVTFSGEVTLLSGFDVIRPAVLNALGQVHAGGTTALYDALQVAFELVRMDSAKVAARPLIVVCTDGVDIGSWLSGNDVIEGARRADVVVHIIQPPGAPTNGLVRNLNTVVGVSGGRSWSATSERDLEGLFTQTLTEMRDRYLLTFTPDSPMRAGWHDLKVSLKNTHGDVLARPGYYVAKGAGSGDDGPNPSRGLHGGTSLRNNRRVMSVERNAKPSAERVPRRSVGILQPFSLRTLTPVRWKCGAAFSMWRSFV